MILVPVKNTVAPGNVSPLPSFTTPLMLYFSCADTEMAKLINAKKIRYLAKLIGSQYNEFF
jgi:hypothetical protein